jgi:hypothetical protein
MAVFGFFFVGLQYLQLILDYSPLKAAVALVPVAAVVLPVSQDTPPGSWSGPGFATSWSPAWRCSVSGCSSCPASPSTPVTCRS